MLGDEKYRELTRAIGLHAHGVGIGAFVYLRRILEDLVDEARKKAASDPGWDDTLFDKSRMGEKIKLLEKQLPAFLVEHRDIYSILSLGIHELTEQECVDTFQVVRVGIELILDERFQALERREKIASTGKDLAKLKGQFRGP